MANSPLRPHLHPQEIARRQRWVAVGVTILTLLLVVTWLVTLPARISQKSGPQTGWRSLIGGTMPKSSFIDTEAIINNDARKKQDAELLEAVTSALQPVVTEAPVAITATTTPAVTTSTSTPETKKKK